MTSEELAQPAPETPPPAPEPAPPAESARPEAPSEDRATFNRDLFAAMLEQQASPRRAPAEPEEPGEAPLASDRVREAREAREARAREAREARPPRPETPATGEAPAPTGRYAGRFDSPEALEAGYRELERARERAEGEKGRAQEIATRLERLLAATLQGQQTRQAQAGEGEAPMGPMRPAAPAPRPMDLQEAVTVLRQEHERLGLADPEGDALKYARALAVVISSDELARQAYMGPTLAELQRRTAESTQLESLKQKFFQSYPDLQSVRLDRLRGVAVETEAALRAQKPDLTGDDFIREWFDLTAREARAIYRTDPGAIATPGPAGRAAPARARPETPRATGAPFAESPSPRAQEPVLTGQAFHLARVFGRGSA